MTKEITIHEGWYWTVGKNYWDCTTHSQEGIGLNRDLFNSEKIIVTVKNQKYEVDSKSALEFIKSHKAHKKIYALEEYLGIEYFDGHKQKPHYRKKRVPAKRKYTKRA